MNHVSVSKPATYLPLRHQSEQESVRESGLE